MVEPQDGSSLNLENYAPSIESKIIALKRGGSVKNLNELEIIYGEAKSLLFQYESAIKKCDRFAELCPELPVASHKQTFNNLLVTLHRATLEARSRLLNMRVSKAREQLFWRSPSSTAVDGNNAAEASKSIIEEPAEALATEITLSLKNMSQTIQDEILRSEASFTVLERSSKRLAATADTYVIFGGVINTSLRMIKNLWRRESNDRLMIGLALLGYFLALFYIASQRLWFPWIGRLLSGIWQIFNRLFLWSSSSNDNSFKASEILGAGGGVAVPPSTVITITKEIYKAITIPTEIIPAIELSTTTSNNSLVALTNATIISASEILTTLDNNSPTDEDHPQQSSILTQLETLGLVDEQLKDDL